MAFLYLFSYACMRFQSLDGETNPGPRRPVLAVCRRPCSMSVVMCWALPGTYSDLTGASSRYDLLLCSETLVSDIRHVSVLVPGFGRPVLLCRGRMPRAQGMSTYVRDGYGTFRQPKFKCDCCEILGFRARGVKRNFYVFSLYRSPDLMTEFFTV